MGISESVDLWICGSVNPGLDFNRLVDRGVAKMQRRNNSIKTSKSIPIFKISFV
jgi:hypothetical protein